MVVVRVTKEDLKMDIHFRTLDDAINYVSFEYEYYSKLYVETERFNTADTRDNQVSFDEDYWNYSDDEEDHHCEPYSEKLRLAFIDSWDEYLEWRIIELTLVNSWDDSTTGERYMKIQIEKDTFCCIKELEICQFDEKEVYRNVDGIDVPIGNLSEEEYETIIRFAEEQ